MPIALRNGSRQVPPADDEPAILAMVERELARHRANLERSLNKSDELERKAASLGLVKERDRITRGLRSDEARARKRFQWAWECFDKLRNGMDPATLIDPETSQPINPDAHAAARKRRPPNRRRRQLQLHRSLHPTLPRPSLPCLRSRKIARTKTRRCTSSLATRSRELFRPSGGETPTDEPDPPLA